MANEELNEKKMTTRSFRVSEEIIEKIREITNELGDKASQQDAFTVMVEAYEMQKAKFSLGDDAKAVEEFQKFVNLLTRRFMDKVEEKQMLNETVHSQYEALLVSKDKVIQDLQVRIKEIEEKYKNEHEANENTQKSNKNLENQIWSLEKKCEEQQKDYLEKMRDKDTLNMTLQESCTELRQKNENMKSIVEHTEQIISEKQALSEQVIDLKKKLEGAERQRKEFEKILEETNKKAQDAVNELVKKQQEDIERMKEQLNIEYEKKVLRKNQEHAEELEVINKGAREEIAKYQERYRELLEKLSN